LASRAPDAHILLRTTAARWLLSHTVRAPFSIVDAAVDTGVIQIDSLRLDAKLTIQRACNFYRRFDELVRDEAALLREQRAAFVVSDAPPLGCAAAAAAGIPSVVISNFTWDWIYEEYREHLDSAPDLIPTIRRGYAHADAAWRLPMHGGFASFDRIVDVPMVARHARHERAQTRAAFDLPESGLVALMSFGGYGLNGFDLRRLDCLKRWTILLTGQPGGDPLPDGVTLIDNEEIYARGFRYEDLVRACDAVVTKPGYGIVSECLANGTAVVYTSRGRFAEYPVLVDALSRLARSAFIAHDEVFAGRWLRALDQAVAMPPPRERPATNGAEIIAAMIAGRVE
jgi:L-arabinokinase